MTRSYTKPISLIWISIGSNSKTAYPISLSRNSGQGMNQKLSKSGGAIGKKVGPELLKVDPD